MLSMKLINDLVWLWFSGFEFGNNCHLKLDYDAFEPNAVAHIAILKRTTIIIICAGE